MKIEIKNLESIQDSARQFMLAVNDFRVVAFKGEMGSGKTTFIKALCNEMGVEDNVSSPSFSIVNEYRDVNDTPIYHFDFYRIEDIREAVDMGYHVYFDSGNFCFVEWPERVESILPDDALLVDVVTNEDGSRELVFDSKTLVSHT